MFACNAQFSMHWGRQCATPDALPDAGSGDAPKGASPGHGGGVIANFLVSFRVGKMLLSVNVCLKCPVFNASGAAVCRPQSVAGRWGRAAAPKGASPGLGGGLNAIFCLVSGASSVGKRVAGVKQVWQCSVLLAVWRRYELRLLKLRELFSFADTLADFNAAEQRQPGQQGRVERPNVHSYAK